MLSQEKLVITPKYSNHAFTKEVFLLKTTSERIDIKNFSKTQLTTWLETNGIRSFRTAQIFRWIYLRQVDRFDEMTDLPKKTRSLMASHFNIRRLEIERIQTSIDGTRKYLFRLWDKNYIESVLLPEKEHYTLCISTQVGCAQGCAFCLTASGGFVRHLSSGEIVSQIIDIRKDLKIRNEDKKITNIVLMGMGEPLANYENVIQALDVITDPDCGLNIISRRVTLSTAGIIPKINELGRNSDINLAISLNATDNTTRSRLMPINRKYPLEQLLEACQQYPLPRRKKITFEYILIKDVNDSEQDALRLIELLRPIRSKVNLIPFNEHAASNFRRPDEARIQRFLQILLQQNMTAIIRKSKGQDISAACGQLRVDKKDKQNVKSLR
jgi:23S rRNA (adenine2503-C2)-methyltransferase